MLTVPAKICFLPVKSVQRSLKHLLFGKENIGGTYLNLIGKQNEKKA